MDASNSIWIHGLEARMVTLRVPVVYSFSVYLIFISIFSCPKTMRKSEHIYMPRTPQHLNCNINTNITRIQMRSVQIKEQAVAIV